MKKKPNILFLFTDDQRIGTIRALGNDQIHTPNLDALVSRGTAFTCAHIPGGTSGAVCMPSRAMLHTGRTLFHIEGEGQSIPENHTTLGECFQAHGYQTFGTGKWHNGKRSYARSFSTGDNIFFGGMADHWNVPAYHFDPTGEYKARPYIADPLHSSTVELRDCEYIEAGKHSTDLFAETSVRFIENRDQTRPFLMYVSLMAPHDPRTMPEKFRTMYNPDDIELPPNFQPGHPFDNGALKTRDELLAEFPRNPDEVRRHIAEYYGMISHLDDALGQIVRALRESGELENTIIVMAGDNGLALGQHGLMGKQNLYDHSVRVPLIFAGPGVPQGQLCDSPVYLLDIFPTLCDLTGADIPDSVEGNSLLPCFETSEAGSREWLYLAYRDNMRSVTNGRMKLIEYACGRTQLFDLSVDSYEMNNLADLDSSQSVISQMRCEMIRLKTEWDDEQNPFGQEFWSKRKDIHSS